MDPEGDSSPHTNLSRDSNCSITDMSLDRVSTLGFPSASLLPRTCLPTQPPSYVLTAWTEGTPSRTSFTVTSIVECITESEKGMRRVLRVNVASEAFQEPRQLICKVAFGRRWFKLLKEESLLYEGKLKPLRGTVVPHYYGFFAGDTYEGMTGVMVLEDCGQPACDSIEHQPLWFRALVLEALVAVHRAGIAFQDPVMSLESNVVIRYDPASDKHVPKFVSFSKLNVTALHHDCPYDSDDVKIGEDEPEPFREDVSCRRLWAAFISTNLFTPSHVDVFETSVPFEYVTDAETLKAHVCFPEGASQSEIEREIASALFLRAEWLEEREKYGYRPIQMY
ncbi:hypothetical protein FKP32DRAFT_1598133 [Trametes sanguinea]|nr:hypothetical protein FKP32DRAFT_1598133 [Trametes sanguinea]